MSGNKDSYMDRMARYQLQNALSKGTTSWYRAWIELTTLVIQTATWPKIGDIIQSRNYQGNEYLSTPKAPAWWGISDYVWESCYWKTNHRLGLYWIDRYHGWGMPGPDVRFLAPSGWEWKKGPDTTTMNDDLQDLALTDKERSWYATFRVIIWAWQELD